MRTILPKEALILAGGFGTRLQSVVSDVAKPMAPVHGKPFLWYLLDKLFQQGVRRTYISVHHLAESISKPLGSKFEKMELHYIHEPSPLGTGGAIQFCLETIKPQMPLFILNGDTYSDCDLNHLISQQEKFSSPLLSVAVTEVENANRYNRVSFGVDGRITTFNAAESDSDWINAGIYLATPDLLNALTELGKTTFSFENDFLNQVCRKYTIQAVTFSGRFIDIGIPDDYARFQAMMASRELA